MRQAVGACVEQCDEIAGFNGCEFAIAGKEVAGFADRTYHVDGVGAARTRADRNNVVVRLVERGTDEIVHGRVGNHEGLVAVALDDEHTGNEGTGLGNEESAGLDEQLAFKAGKAILDGRSVFSHFGCRVEGTAVIIDAEPSASVDGFEDNAFAAELADQFGDCLLYTSRCV